MDIFLTHIQDSDGFLFLIPAAAMVALILFRRLCRHDMSRPKDARYAGYWGVYEHKSYTESWEIEELGRKLMAKSGQASPCSEPELPVVWHP